MENIKSSKFYQSINWPFKFLLLIWGIHLFQVVTSIRLGWLGVYPQTISGLKGVLFSPLIHADWGHLLSNTPPLFVMTAIILYFYRRVALSSFLMIYLLSGLAVWLFGRHVYHIGASGVIYGLVAFVFWNGIFRRNLKSIALALIVVFYYGSMILGVLPGQEGISWESHLLGGFVGMFTSFWFRGSIEKDEETTEYSWEKAPEDQDERYFLERDIFEQTKAERRRNRTEDEEDLGSWFSSRTW